ncbi:MAG: hypothetical protein L6Q63_02325 [Giesbergeria sp.]|nr:hypothetical protein [Giesbergeria sp.]
MAYTYPVKWITSEMCGAPVLNGTPGTLIAVLDAFLLTGWGAATAISVEVLDGVGTAIFNAGITFTQHAVVAISGATPAALNGEARVLTSASDRITFETDAPNGTATGSIVFKFAPQGGWEKAFSGTNKAVYRSTHLQSAKHCLRVDDTGTTTARVVGYETMSDVDSGVGPFPTALQLSGGGYVHKSTSANTNAVGYAFAADQRIVYWCPMPATVSGSADNYTSANVRGFGDPIALAPGGDAWATLLSSGGSVFSDYSSLSGGEGETGGALVMARPLSGIGGAVIASAKPYVGGRAKRSGFDDQALGAAPSPVDGALRLSRMYVGEGTGNQITPRAEVPGLWYLPYNNASSLLPRGTIVQGADGRKLLAIVTGSSTNTPQRGAALIDITGPWRE